MLARGRILYFALGLIVLVSVTYRVRETRDRIDLLLQPADHVRDPFQLSLPGNVLTAVEPEAEVAGLGAGDVLSAALLMASLRASLRGQTIEGANDGGLVVGLLPAPLFRYDQAFVTLEPGDVLVAYTDGISEAMNSANEE